MRLTHALTAIALAATAGCGPLAAAPAGTPWDLISARDLNCAAATPVVPDNDSHDVTNDKIPDQFVTMRCAAGDPSRLRWDQLEVFRGGSPAGDPERLGVVVHNWQSIEVTCLTFRHGQAFARTLDHADGQVWWFTIWYTGKDLKSRESRDRPAAAPAGDCRPR